MMTPPPDLRLYDLAQWGMACAPGLGRTPEDIVSALQTNRQDGRDDLLDEDTVGAALLTLLRAQHPDQEGRVTLSDTTAGYLPRVQEAARGRLQHLTPRGLGRKLAYLQPVLRSRGVECDRSRPHATVWTLSALLTALGESLQQPTAFTGLRVLEPRRKPPEERQVIFVGTPVAATAAPAAPAAPLLSPPTPPVPTNLRTRNPRNLRVGGGR